MYERRNQAIADFLTSKNTIKEVIFKSIHDDFHIQDGDTIFNPFIQNRIHSRIIQGRTALRLHNIQNHIYTL